MLSAAVRCDPLDDAGRTSEPGEHPNTAHAMTSVSNGWSRSKNPSSDRDRFTGTSGMGMSVIGAKVGRNYATCKARPRVSGPTTVFRINT